MSNTRIYASIYKCSYNKCLLITIMISKFHIYTQNKKKIIDADLASQLVWTIGDPQIHFS